MLFSKLLTVQTSASAQNILYMWGNNTYGTLGVSFVGVSNISSPVKVNTSRWLKLAAGIDHMLAIKSDGTLWSWGNNLYGQCGTNVAYSQYRSSPVIISAGWQTVDVSLGGTWALGIKTDGTLWAWGNNAAGALGTASLTSTSSPVLVSGPAGASWSAISAGISHALAITTLGRLYAWGSGVAGRLGDLSLVTKSSPILVSGPASTSWLAVSAGGSHSMALTTANSLYMWGAGGSGQLGNNSVIVNVSSPIAIFGTASNISAGDTHSLIISTTGVPYGTGSNASGQLGLFSLTQRSAFTIVSGPAATSWSSISAGLSHSAGITTTGRLYAWGLNTSGQVGINSLTSVSSPVLVSGPATTSWSLVQVKNLTSVAITTQGVLYSWGSNLNYPLGLESNQTFSSPVAVLSPQSGSWTAASASTSFGQFIDSQNNLYFAGDSSTYFYPLHVCSTPVQIGTSSWTAVAGGDSCSFGITTEGRLYSWGINNLGEGGRLNTTTTNIPTLVSGPATTSWSIVSAAGGFAGAITNLGALYMWGLGTSGQLGDSTLVSKSSPIKIGSNSWIALSTGGQTGYGIDLLGRLYAWGANSGGQIGNNSITSTSSPVLVSGPANTSWSLLAAGNQHALAATLNRTLYAWGLGNLGQLGNNSTLTTSSPVQVLVPNQVLSWFQISTGALHSLGIRSDRTLWAWGSSASGQIGNGTLVGQSYPIQIGQSTWNAVAASVSSSHAIRSDGTLWSWGGNSAGQLGTLSTTATSSPVLVSGPAGASWSVISAGEQFVLAITTTGILYAWGQNTSIYGGGQLGDLTTVSKSSPILVSGPAATSWSLVAAGAVHSVGITSLGRLYAWGSNPDGELGDNSTVAKSSPVLVSGPATTSWQAIAAGPWHTLAITTIGRLYAWGWNNTGQLGDNSTAPKISPVLVSGPATTSWAAIGAGGDPGGSFYEQSYAITSIGRLYAWGNNGSGQLGDNTLVSKSSPILVSGPAATSWSAIASQGMGNFTAIAITTSSLGYGWGLNTSGQAGIGSLTTVSSPVVLSNTSLVPESWTAIGAGRFHSMGISTRGVLYMWGTGTSGQLGDISIVNKSSPVIVSGPAATSWIAVSVGYAGNFAGAITT